LVLVESLASGTPVIASNLPGVRMVVRDREDGLLVRPGDADALATGIATILRDEQARAIMGRVGRERVAASYSWELIGSSLEAIYQQVLCEAPQRAQFQTRGAR
jgi:glycosyltransferase involved in cell wall biosynthesis